MAVCLSFHPCASRSVFPSTGACFSGLRGFLRIGWQIAVWLHQDCGNLPLRASLLFTWVARLLLGGGTPKETTSVGVTDETLVCHFQRLRIIIAKHARNLWRPLPEVEGC